MLRATKSRQMKFNGFLRGNAVELKTPLRMLSTSQILKHAALKQRSISSGFLVL